MVESHFLVNVNSLEAFNTTVPEAMAAGCVPFCYPALGGRTRDGENALVFHDHDVYALWRPCELLDDLPGAAPLLERLRSGGRRTAASYSPEATADALERLLDRLGVSRQ
jgi:glycosyltransferase involved in cell wall biosynthesis